MCVLAGAGTGKTRAITHRIAYGVHAGVYQARSGSSPSRSPPAPPGRCAPASATLGRRGRPGPDLPLGGAAPAAVLLAAGRRRCRARDPRPQGAGRRRGGRAAAAAVRPDRHPRPRRRGRVGQGHPAHPGDVCRRTPGRRAVTRPGIDLREIARLFETYEELQDRAGRHRLRGRAAAHGGHPRRAGRTSPRPVRGQYRHFVVDEYQDVNALQQRLLDLWLGDRDDVCVVGDAGQTIYSFTGATPDHLLRFPRRFPHARVVKLVRDYRSTPQVVAPRQPSRGPRRSARVRGTREVPAPATRAGRPSRRPGRARRCTEYPDDPAEAAAVAADIAGLVREGTPASEIAVLFRTNAQSEAFEPALADAGVPYLVRGRRAVLRPPRGASGRAAAARCGPRRRRLGRTLPRLGPGRAGRRGVDAGAAELGWGASGSAGSP